MAKLTIYTLIYFILMVVTAIEIVLIGFPLPHDLIVASLISLAAAKAVLIALYFQHLRYEPWPLSGPAILSMVAVLLFLSMSILSLVGMR